MNVTVSLPEELVRQARHRAVDRGVSLSRYIACVVEEDLGKREKLRQEALARMSARMAKGLNLGLHGKIPWTRDELHER